MRLSSACLIALCTLAAPALSAESGSRAPVEKTFLIPASEGYGVGECLTSPGSECGQVVADAWCEAQGFAAAQSFGVAPTPLAAFIRAFVAASRDQPNVTSTLDER